MLVSRLYICQYRFVSFVATCKQLRAYNLEKVIEKAWSFRTIHAVVSRAGFKEGQTGQLPRGLHK